MRSSAVRIIKAADWDIKPQSLHVHEWTSKLVCAALLDSYQILSDTTGRVGPSKSRGFWPEYMPDFADLMARAEIEQIRTKVRRRQRTAHEIKRMEMALCGWTDRDGNDHPAWLNGPLLNYDRPRKCLIGSVMCKYYSVKIKDMCAKNRWPISTFKRHRDFAADQIAQNLNKLNVEVSPWACR